MIVGCKFLVSQSCLCHKIDNFAHTESTHGNGMGEVAEKIATISVHVYAVGHDCLLLRGSSLSTAWVLTLHL